MRIRATDVLRRPVAMNSSVSGIGSGRLNFHSLGLLRCMGMRIAAIDFQFPIHVPAKSIVRNHSAHGAFDQQLRMTSPARPDIFRFMSADVTGKTHVTFLFLFLSAKPDFFCVDDNDEVAGVDVWRENRFVFPAQQVRSLNGDSAKHLAFGINDPPLLWHVAGFGGKSFHVGRKEHGTYGSRQRMSTSVRLPQMSLATRMSHGRNLELDSEDCDFAPARRRFSGVVS